MTAQKRTEDVMFLIFYSENKLLLLRLSLMSHTKHAVFGLTSARKFKDALLIIYIKNANKKSSGFIQLTVL